MPSKVTVFRSQQTEMQINSIVEDLDSLQAPEQTADWGKYDGPYTMPWNNGAELEGNKDPSDFNFQTDVIDNQNASYLNDRFSSMMKIAETEAQIPKDSVFIPLHRDYSGYYFPEKADPTGIVNVLLNQEGNTCRAEESKYDLYFDDCGVNTSYLGYQAEGMEAVEDPSIPGICLPDVEEIMGPRGKAGTRYKTYPATRVLYLIKNIKIFRNTTTSGVKDPQPYQLSFFAKSNIPSSLSIAITRNSSSAVSGSTSDLLHDGKVRYLNDSSLSSCTLTSKWKFYWINFSLPTSLSSLTESDFYLNVWCYGDRNPISLDISDIRLEKTEELCGNKPNYLYASIYKPRYQQLQLQLSNGTQGQHTEEEYPSLILMRINRYSEYNRIKLVIQGNITEEVPTMEGYDIFQYKSPSNIIDRDEENIRSIVLLQRTSNTGSAYNVYSLTNKSSSYLKVGTVTLSSGSKIMIGATDLDMKYTSVGIESIIACYDPDMIGNTDILKKGRLLIFNNGNLQIPKTMDDNWSNPEIETLNNIWVVSSTNIEETDI